MKKLNNDELSEIVEALKSRVATIETKMVRLEIDARIWARKEKKSIAERIRLWFDR